MIASKDGHPANVTQSDKFKQAARDLGADEDEKHWDDRLRKLARVNPAPEKPD